MNNSSAEALKTQTVTDTEDDDTPAAENNESADV